MPSSTENQIPLPLSAVIVSTELKLNFSWIDPRHNVISTDVWSSGIVWFDTSVWRQCRLGADYRSVGSAPSPRRRSRGVHGIKSTKTSFRTNDTMAKDTKLLDTKLLTLAGEE